jgi:large exoprotein involved in heme utilization and adhesion
VLFDVSRLNMGGGTGAISNFGTLQTNNNSQYIGLIGGNVTLDGGKIIAPGGRVDIGGLSGAGTVSIDNNGFVFSSSGVGRSNVLLTNDAGIIVRATGTLDTVNTFFNNATSNGSSINISANNLDILNAGAISNTLPAAIDAGLETNSGVQTKAAGDINIDVTGKVSLNNSAIKNTLRSGAEGSIGDVNLLAGALDINNNSFISTTIAGKGNAGNVTVTAKDAVSLVNGQIVSTVSEGGMGNGGSININAGSVSLKDGAFLSASTFGVGNAGNIIVTAKDTVSLINGQLFSAVAAGGVGKGGTIDINAGSLSLTNGAQLLTSTRGASTTQPAGQGDAGNITVKVSGAVDIAGNGTSPSAIFSDVETGTKGNGGSISITAGSFSLRDGAKLTASTAGTGNAGNIIVTAKDAVALVNGDIFSTVKAGGVGKGGTINIKSASLSLTNGAQLLTSTRGASTTQPAAQGDAGNITVDVSGAVDITGDNGEFYSAMFSTVGTGTKGNGGNISIAAGSFSLRDGAKLTASTFGIGNAGDINLKTTGDINISGYDKSSPNPVTSNTADITSNTHGQGDTGKITIDTQGKLSVVNGGKIFSAIASKAVGNSKGIRIAARELELSNDSAIVTSLLPNAQGNAGDIDIKTTGDINISGYDSFSTNPVTSNISYISSGTDGQGDAGKITIDTQGKLFLINSGLIISDINKDAVGNSQGIRIAAREVELNNKSFIGTSTDNTSQVNGQGKAGDVDLQVKGTISLDNSSIVTRSIGVGDAGNISLAASRVFFNGGGILSDSDSTSGGNVTLAISDRLLLRNDGFITTNSGSTGKNGNGGNITISSPLIIALPGDNNITANANGGNGGNVNITSQGLFGIQYRAQGSPLTNDITASSTFGQSGTVNVSTPGTDPGRDSTELPNTATDASNQISQVCGANNRQNKLTVTGRGGLPPTANDPLTSDVVWQDARATSSQPAVSKALTPVKLVPPAVGWIFDGKGKVTLVAAGTQGQPTGTRVVCPNAIEQ